MDGQQPQQQDEGDETVATPPGETWRPAAACDAAAAVTADGRELLDDVISNADGIEPAPDAGEQTGSESSAQSSLFGDVESVGDSALGNFRFCSCRQRRKHSVLEIGHRS